jgi:hypothetical protein
VWKTTTQMLWEMRIQHINPELLTKPFMISCCAKCLCMFEISAGPGEHLEAKRKRQATKTRDEQSGKIRKCFYQWGVTWIVDFRMSSTRSGDLEIWIDIIPDWLDNDESTI